MKYNKVIIATVVILLLMFVTSDDNDITAYGQLLDKSHVNENCGVSINYPSDWKLEEEIQNDSTLPVNYIGEFHPKNEDSLIICRN